MVWLSLGTITPSKDWAFTAPVKGSFFRVQHSTVGNSLQQGYIAQASGFAPVELSGIRKLYSKQQYDVYQFVQPECWSDRTIAVRNGYYQSSETWTVAIEVWQSDEEFAHSIEELSKQIELILNLIKLLL